MNGKNKRGRGGRGPPRGGAKDPTENLLKRAAWKFRNHGSYSRKVAYDMIAKFFADNDQYKVLVCLIYNFLTENSDWKFQLKIPIETSNWNFQLQIPIENFLTENSNWKFQLKLPIENSNWNFQLKIPIENSNWKFQ